MQTLPEHAPIRASTPPGTGPFRLTVFGEPGRTARIKRSRDLVSWELAFEVPIPAGGQKLIDPAAVAERMLF
jgi:hypothetical protein